MDDTYKTIINDNKTIKLNQNSGSNNVVKNFIAQGNNKKTNKEIRWGYLKFMQ